MKKNLTIGLLVMATVAVAVPFSIRKYFDHVREAERQEEMRYEREFREEMRLAREEGIPTTVAEFEATLPKIKPEDNAGPIYVELDKAMSKLDRKTRPTQLDSRLLLWNSSAETRARAKLILDEARLELELIEKASKRSQSLIPRDWSKGAAILYPEYSRVKSGATALRIRSALFATEGDHASALRDAQSALQVASHMYQEPTMLGHTVGIVIETMSLQHLGDLVLRYPEEGLYRSELLRALRHRSLPPLRSFYGFDLIEVLSLMELSLTPSGRAEMGLTESDEVPNENLFLAIQSRGEGRVKVVRAMRDQWAALGEPEPANRTALNRAGNQLFQGLMSFLNAAKMREGPGSASDWVAARARTHVTYEALARALEPSKIPKRIKTDDLLSPYDQKPVKYSFENGQIQIEVSASDEDGGVRRFTIGPREPAKETQR